MDEDAARSLIAEHLGVSQVEAGDTVRLADLGADPLDVVALVLHLEKAFRVRISDAAADGCTTVADLLAALAHARSTAHVRLPLAAGVGCRA